MQWVCPRQTSSSDCVLDAAQSSAGQLVGVGRGGDVRWWRVREEGERLSVELMALLNLVVSLAEWDMVSVTQLKSSN